MKLVYGDIAGDWLGEALGLFDDGDWNIILYMNAATTFGEELGLMMNYDRCANRCLIFTSDGERLGLVVIGLVDGEELGAELGDVLGLFDGELDGDYNDEKPRIMNTIEPSLR